MKAHRATAAWFLLSAVSVFALATERGPSAEVVEPVIDLGTVAKGRVFELVFEVRNTGDADLVLTDPRSNCGCTLLDFDANIAAGASGFVRSEVDTRTITGPTTTKLSVRTNDPARPRLDFTIHLEVEVFLGVVPPRARWNTVETETTGTIGVTVFSIDGADFEVLDATTTLRDVTVSKRPARDDERVPERSGSQWRIEMTLGSDPDIGAIDGRVELTTDHPEQNLAFVPLSGFVRPLILIEPKTNELGSVYLRGEARQGRYQVRNFGSSPMTVNKLETLGVSGLTATLEPQTDGYIYNVVLHFDPEAMPAGEFEDTVVLHTDLEQRPRIEIPLRGTIVRSPE